MSRVEVVAHDSAWRAKFEAEAKRIADSLGPVVVRVHHIGSTAIPGLPAKPIVDILLEVTDLRALDDKTGTMQGLGYEAMGEFGIPGRRYFRRDEPIGVRIHQVHAFVADGGEVARHIAFRDYLIAHAAVAREYGALKQRLAHSHPSDTHAYMNGKDAFIKEQQARALEWRAGQSSARG